MSNHSPITTTHSVRYRCDLCETEIPDLNQARLLCDPESLPEAPTVYLVKACCLEQFEARFGKAWDRYTLSSASASMLLPCTPACGACS